jgi:hypothetical protein
MIAQQETYFIFLIEDISGEMILKCLLDKIGLKTDSYVIHHYKGIGGVPKNLTRTDSDPKKRQLLTQLPRLLKGFSQRYQGIDYRIFVVCDLDERCLKEFRQELLNVAKKCNASNNTQFCFSVKEMEAWLLGDIEAVKEVYPSARLRRNYIETKHGSWDTLADTIKKNWSKDLLKRKKLEGYNVIGKHKSQWAKEITPYIEIERNQSPSFQYFCKKIKSIV